MILRRIQLIVFFILAYITQGQAQLQNQLQNKHQSPSTREQMLSRLNQQIVITQRATQRDRQHHEQLSHLLEQTEKQIASLIFSLKTSDQNISIQKNKQSILKKRIEWNTKKLQKNREKLKKILLTLYPVTRQIITHEIDP